ncbi:MAG: SurA N-terminal domain-containing protein, partial [Paracoccaceae bacterium]
MAQDDDTPRKKKSPSAVMWVVMLLLIGGLASFGVSSFGGNVRTIGKVGDRNIDANTYARAMRMQLNEISQQFGQQLTLTQAQALGQAQGFSFDQQVLQSVVTQTALDNEAARIGLSVGDTVVAAQVTATPSFQNASGAFDRETYRQTLQQNSLTEGEFETTIRDDLTRSILQGAVVGGFQTPDILTDTLWAYAAEQRSFTLLPLTEADLTTPIPTPTEADLTTYYTANIAGFTRGEAKRITYVSLLPDTIAATITVDEAETRAAYDARIAEYMIPERRLVERLVYPSQEQADAAKARLDSGEAFDVLVKERGLELADVDLGDVGKDDLGAAGEAVFALTGPGVVGPFATDLGPALFRMNAILAAQETAFEEAKPALLAELQTEAARREIANRVEAIDDLLAGGATLEDLAKDEGLTLGQTDYVAGDRDNDPIAAYTDFRTGADAIVAGDFAEAILLDDGGLVALRLDEIVPPTPIPMADITDRVTAAWRSDTVAVALSARAVEVKAAVEAGATLESQGTVTQVAPT